MHPHNILIKVYGNLYPADSNVFKAVQAVCGEAAELDGDLLRLSFEGVWFPLEDMLTAIRPHLSASCRGKVDYLDLEAWTLTRHTIIGKEITVTRAPLNNVLAYSGH